MNRIKVYNMELTLRCGQCHKECELADPFAGPQPGEQVTVAERLHDGIRESMVRHQAADECEPPRGELSIGGKAYWVVEKV